MNGTGASYGPPNGANFTDGPITIGSGDSTDLFAGNNPGRAGVEQLLFTVAIDPADLVALGQIEFEIDGVGSVNLMAADFFDPATAGFPANIDGIANGAVNGIKFPEALVAGILVDAPELGGLTNLADIGNFTLTTPVDARVDIFGVNGDGVIIKNSPNSHSLGVTAPEPLGLALAGSALALLAARRRS